MYVCVWIYIFYMCVWQMKNDWGKKWLSIFFPFGLLTIHARIVALFVCVIVEYCVVNHVINDWFLYCSATNYMYMHFNGQSSCSVHLWGPKYKRFFLAQASLWCMVNWAYLNHLMVWRALSKLIYWNHIDCRRCAEMYKIKKRIL